MDDNILYNESIYRYSFRDLIYEYSTSEYHNGDPRVSGPLDETELDRRQAREVIYFINEFAVRRNFRDRCSCIKVEKMLHIYVPHTIYRQDEITAWIEEHWFNFL